jgi:hypothetical protein
MFTNKLLEAVCCAGIALLAACSEPAAVEIKDVCAKGEGVKIITTGYISLPKTIDTVQLTRKGAIEAVGLQLFVMTKTDATGDAVKATFWVSDKSEPNKIKPLPKVYTWNDLLVYTDDGRTLAAGQLVKVTGTVKPDERTGCEIDVAKIEVP